MPDVTRWVEAFAAAACTAAYAGSQAHSTPKRATAMAVALLGYVLCVMPYPSVRDQLLVVTPSRWSSEKV